MEISATYRSENEEWCVFINHTLIKRYDSIEEVRAFIEGLMFLEAMECHDDQKELV